MQQQNSEMKQKNFLSNNSEQLDSYKEIITLLKREINKLKMENDDLRQKEPEENSSEIRKKILEEYNNLKEKEDVVNISMNLLSQKELEMNEKENEIKRLISSYNYLFSKSHFQLEVYSENNKSEYTYQFNQLDNITKINLTSYSIPPCIFNIRKGKNNILKYKMFKTKPKDNLFDEKDDEETENEDNEETENEDNEEDCKENKLKIEELIEEDKEIELVSGLYNINSLIEMLNEKSDLKFNLKFDQKVEVTNLDKFELIETPLSKTVLGFTQKCADNETYISENLWDLRLNEKIYLYLNNISDEPFGMLNFNGQSNCQLQFEQPISLDNLEVSFKDEDGDSYDFNNLKHSLNFQIEVQKEF